jgi:DGQHR domain-containing protein
MRDTIHLVSSRDVSFHKEARYRNQLAGTKLDFRTSRAEYEILIESGMYNKPKDVKNMTPFSAIGMPNDEVNITYDLPHWEVFDNTVWKLFVQMNFDHVNRGMIGVALDDNEHFGANGMFINSDFVFITKTLYAPKSNGQDLESPSVKEQIIEWMSNFSSACAYLDSEYLECKNKRFIPLIVTRGYKISNPLKEQLKESYGNYFINDRFVDELHRIAGKNGDFARTVLCQELFKGEQLPYSVPSFNALMEEIDGARVYSFFADAKDVVDTMYVHRRLPQDTGFAMAYQRMVKPDKVLNIGTYLQATASFFPNSIVVAVNGENFEQIDGNMGKLTLPNIYGNMWIIDGQHRLYGSAFSNTNKPISICALQGLDGMLQAKQFTSINSNQTKVSGDLIWDLKGELFRDALFDSSDTKENQVMCRQYYVSNVWKAVNQNPNSPISSRIKIPSQTPSEVLGLGALCKNLDDSLIWAPGVLLRKSQPEDVVMDVELLLVTMFAAMNEAMPGEWAKKTKKSKDKNWLLISYSMEIICELFKDGCLYFSSARKFSSDWLSDEASLQLMRRFGKDISEMILSEDYGFFAGEKDIRKAGNQSLRKDFYSDIVIGLRETSPTFYSPEFAPGIGFEDYSSLKISNKIKRKVEELEFQLRAACISALELEGPKNITKYLNSKYRDTIENGLEQERNWSDITIFTEEKKFEYLSLSQLFEIMIKRFEKFNFTVKKAFIIDRFKHVQLIRNAIAHPRDFPSFNAKKAWLVSLDQVTEWFKDMTLKEDL